MNNFNNINKNNNKNNNPFFSIKTQTDNNTISTIPIENLIVINNIKSNTINNNKNKNNTNFNNNLNKKDNTIYKRSFPKNFRNKSRNNINEMKMLQSDSTSTRTHHNTSRNELLYEYNKIYTEKLNSKRRELNLKIKKNANPNITEKAKKIKRNSYKFSDRLYPNNTVINYSEEIYSGNYNIYNKPKKIIKEEIFSFKPKINYNSKKISKYLEKSFSRLTKSLSTNNFKKNNNLNENEYKTSEIENIKCKYNYLKKNYSLNNLKNNNKITIKSPNNLYERGMESIKSKNLQYLKNEEEKKNLYKNYSYSPNLNKSFYKRNNKNYNIINLDKKNNNINSKDRIQNFYEKNLLWKEKITNKNNQKFVEKFNKQFDECTFSPVITKKIMENDNDFIKKNIIQIAQYVQKRKKFLENKEKEKMNNKKIFFEYEYLNKNIGISNVNKLKKNKRCIIYNFFSE